VFRSFAAHLRRSVIDDEAGRSCAASSLGFGRAQKGELKTGADKTAGERGRQG